MKSPFCIVVLSITLLFACSAHAADNATPVVVGSKNFNEGYILAEIIAQLLESRDFRVDRKFGLGGTLVCFEALRNGKIDVYPEYSGTIEQAILKMPGGATFGEIRRAVRDTLGMRFLDSFGFNNTYAIALERSRAEALGVRTIGDLASHAGLHIAFSHEFINRKDGWPGLAGMYGLTATPTGIEHGLAYQAIREGKVDVTDVYSTDGDIRKYDLVLLEDDRHYFPTYLAAPLVGAHADMSIDTLLGKLAGKLDEPGMQALNAAVLIDGRSFSEVADRFLSEQGLTAAHEGKERSGMWTAMMPRVVRHLQLTFIALLAGIAVALPMGIMTYRIPSIAKPVLYFTGLLQTIPSIALLAFMIPLFGVGLLPAVIALFLYALLPILRNTTTALFSIDPLLKRISTGMGLTPLQRLRHIELPLAAPLIFAGIRTAAVINIGTATLAAFIGAGGLGEPIVTGLALNDSSLILQGAIPAATLAILTEFFFEGIERLFVPQHLLQKSVA